MTKSIKISDKVTYSPKTIEGYRFLRLETPDGQEVANNGLTISSKPQEFYAMFVSESKVSVKYVDQDNNELTQQEDKIINGFYGDSYDVTGEDYRPAIAGYRLDTTKLPTNSSGTMADEDIVVTYVYVKQLTINFNTNGGTNINNQVIDINTPISEPTQPTKDATTFDGWYTS
ncbi:MucBP domain-containing protein, partial [Acinetobacter baumannii]|uniref:MucBP domain-containing protein n=1 Tax=Acinetobacter baumannii TaxID=470 RepID=UPI001AEC7CFB|nr:MucBP domain-containing protein [Acinetobacter baumannii]